MRGSGGGSVGGLGAALSAPRQLSANSLARLSAHALFDFELPSTAHAITTRVTELRDLLLRSQEEHDLPDLLDSFVHALEDEIHEREAEAAAMNTAMGGVFVLAALQDFRQQVEILLDLDHDASLAESGAAVGNMFAAAATTKTATTQPSPTRRQHAHRAHASARAATAARLQSPPATKKAPPVSVAAAPLTASTTIATTQVAPPNRRHRERHHAKDTKHKPDDASPVIKDRSSSSSYSSEHASETVCHVCWHPDSLEHDPIVICDLCGTSVHQSCYRIEDIPADDWFCHPCARYLRGGDVAHNVTPTHELVCVACLQRGGAFIAAVGGGGAQWVHMACSMFLPELYIQSSRKHEGEGEVVAGMEHLRARRQLRCCFCKKKKSGACAQCAVGKCTTAYHVICGLKHGIPFAFMNDRDQFGSGCARHAKQFRVMTGDEPDDFATASEQRAKERSSPARNLRKSTASASASPSSRPDHGKRKRKRAGSEESSEDEDEDDHLLGDDDDDGVLLDEEQDDSDRFLSESDIDDKPLVSRKSPKAKASPKATTASPRRGTKTPPRLESPGPTRRLESPKRTGRPVKQQAPGGGPTFGKRKQLAHPPLLPAAAMNGGGSQGLVGLVNSQPMPINQVLASAPTTGVRSAAMGAINGAMLKMPPNLPAPMVKEFERVRVTKSQVLVPVASRGSGHRANSAVTTDGRFKEVLVVIPSLPLGISIRTGSRLKSGKATSGNGGNAASTNVMVIALGPPHAKINPVVASALARGILRDGDELISVNDVSMRGRDADELQHVLSVMTPPYRCWFLAQERRPLAAVAPALPKCTSATTTATTSVTATTSSVSVPAPVSTSMTVSSVTSETGHHTTVTTTSVKPVVSSTPTTTTAKGTDDQRSLVDDARSIDWPWFYLRSDGKLAMNSFWQSLDAGFFTPTQDPRVVWRDRVSEMEAHTGLRILARSRPHRDRSANKKRKGHKSLPASGGDERDSNREHFRDSESLLLVPTQEVATPRWLVEHRRAQYLKKKQRSAGTSDMVFVGVDVEHDGDHTDWNALPPLAVGTTVQVAKRTWPGINKLGGAGRIKRVHEVSLNGEDSTAAKPTTDDGEPSTPARCRYVYDVAYVLGGSEKRVDRQWITVVNMNASATSKSETTAEKTKPSSEERAATTNEGSGRTKETEKRIELRLGMRLRRLATTEDASLERPPPENTKPAADKAHFRVTVSTTAVHMQQLALPTSKSKTMPGSNGNGETTEALSPLIPLHHVHFPIKEPAEDKLISTLVQGELAFMYERDSEDAMAMATTTTSSSSIRDGGGGGLRGGDPQDEYESEDDCEIQSLLMETQAQYREVMDRLETQMSVLQHTVATASHTKLHRTDALDAIRVRHYEDMYREVQAAMEAAEDDSGNSSDSSSDSDADVDGDGGRGPDSTSGKQQAAMASPSARSRGRGRVMARKRVKREDAAGEQSDAGSEDPDESCGGLFVNKLKQEGHEVCMLCELTGGDLVGTSCGHVVHPQCAMYTPETFFRDGVVHGMDQIPSEERRALLCAICGTQRGRSKVQCAHARCVKAFHVACAFVSGRLTKDPYYQAWCPRHLRSSGMADKIEWPPHLMNVRGLGNDLAEEEEDGEEEEEEMEEEEEEVSTVKRRGRPTALAAATERERKRKRRRRSTNGDGATASAGGGVDAAAGAGAVPGGQGVEREAGVNEEMEGVASRKRSRKPKNPTQKKLQSVQSVTNPAVVERDDQHVVIDVEDSPVKVTPKKVVVVEVEDEDDGRDAKYQREVLAVGATVDVQAREWTGSNKPGGVARITKVHMDSDGTTTAVLYDVAYVLSGKEKRVEAKYVHPYHMS